LTEIVAGGKEENEDDRDAAFREVEEETGYRVISLERIGQYYVSPGLMSERVTIFVAGVDETSKANNGGGAKDEDEDIELIWVPRNEALDWLSKQNVGDAKTMIAIQWHVRSYRQ
jgi:nudix-type nucleoside diphosphatase (YffH/AdpP family)